MAYKMGIDSYHLSQQKDIPNYSGHNVQNEFFQKPP